MEDLTGTTIDRYKIIRELGRGGMAVVYRAVDSMLDRNVAVKMILSESSGKGRSDKLLKRFNREAKTLASLSHPNIVKVLDYGEHEGTPYLVMEFISGGALKTRMGKPMPYAEAAALLVPIARALQHAHQQRIVHRDVKPENILINDSDQPMLSDFGILKLVDVEESHGLTGTGKIVGTPAYMSPEQIRGREVDGRADMYSLGIVFFEMVSGRKPYNANTPIELSMQHLHDPIPKAKQFVRDLPAEADQVIAKSIAKNPEDRYQNMAAFAEALEKLGGTTARTSTAERRAIRAAEEKKHAAEKGSEEKKKGRVFSPLFLSMAIIILLGAAGLLYGRSADWFGTPTPTQIPPTATAPATARPLAASPTKPAPVTDTPATEVSPDAPTATAVSANMLRPENVDKVIGVNRMDKISVIRVDWIESGNWLVNAGFNAVSFIDAQTLAVKQKVTLDGGIPLSMASANTRIYILLNNSIKVIDTDSFSVIKTISPITGGAISIAASADGRLLALGISDNKTQLLNAEDGSVVRNLKSNYGGWSVAFSPDSQYIVSGTSQGILRWETATGIWQLTSGGQDKTIKSLAFSHDGKTIAGGGDGFIYIWNAANGELLHQATGVFGVVNSLDFSPDDSMLVSGTADNIVRFWNVATASILKELPGHASQILGVCFSPDGEKIASGAGIEATIRIWGLP
jgi:tRNA A-37 threonylcarbamoyl transferase component Bud32